MPVYIRGTRPGKKQPVFAVAVETDKGWRVRSTEKDIMNDDYTSDESISDIFEWVFVDLTRVETFERHRLLEHIVDHAEAHSSVGFLSGDQTWTAEERGVVVVEHLEKGW